MVIDYKNGIQGENVQNVQIVDGLLSSDGRTIENVTFCNFPRITAVNKVFVNCAFEDCGVMTISGGKLKDCRLHRVDTLYLENANAEGCQFRHLRCEDDCVICLEDGEITDCSFADVVLKNESYLCDAVGDVWVSGCKFKYIRTDRKDKELFICEETAGKIFKRKKRYTIVDEESCTGLEWITGLNGVVEIGSFRMH